MIVQCGVNLPGAENDTLNFGRVNNSFRMFRIGNDPLEMRVAREILDT
jgi:hypothetical protein